MLTYLLNVTNRGPSDATDIIVTDRLPAGVTYHPNADCSEANHVVTCQVDALAAKASHRLTLAVDVDAPTGTKLANTAEVQGAQEDWNPGNNRHSIETIVTEHPPVFLPFVCKGPRCQFEPFSNPDSGWPIRQGPTTQWRYHNGKYYGLTLDTELAHWALSPLGRFEDYWVQVEVNWSETTSHEDDTYGIVFDFTSKQENSSHDQYYYFGVNNNQNVNTYELSRIEGEEWFPLIRPAPVPGTCIKARTAVNTLKVERGTFGVRLILNGCLLSSYSEPKELRLTRPGHVGVLIYPSDHKDAQAYFDNFTICDYDRSSANNGLQIRSTSGATVK
jgi:hypothetical protein